MNFPGLPLSFDGKTFSFLYISQDISIKTENDEYVLKLLELIPSKSRKRLRNFTSFKFSHY